jgi:hypothetical protein
MLGCPRISPDPSSCGHAVTGRAVACNTLANQRPQPAFKEEKGGRKRPKALEMNRSLRKYPLRLGPVWGAPRCRRGVHWTQSRGHLHRVEGCTGCNGGVNWTQSGATLDPVWGSPAPSGGVHWTQGRGHLPAGGGWTGCSQGVSSLQDPRHLEGGGGCTAPWCDAFWAVEDSLPPPNVTRIPHRREKV